MVFAMAPQSDPLDVEHESTTSTQYSIALRVSLKNVPGVLGRLTTAIGEHEGNIFSIENFVAKGPTLERQIAVNCSSVEHQEQILQVVANVDDVEILDHFDRTFRMHEGGKIETLPLCPVEDIDDLSMAYTPGVARVCTAIAEDERLADEYVRRIEQLVRN